ncbi:hypothetical protein EC844_12133 [Acinetobacter calcoaceticus]|uniref:DUF4199 domain-containing protein n=1 Tax=Acinetobacter calcoaceticus TaxID=471 RepID=A0A4V6NJ87_ACICA|nr:hypothetical protein EC844_12133 [Acinetobacter calcoaceticus]
MTQAISPEHSPEKSIWGWKGAIIATVLSVFFLGIFYLAMSNEPDYMPSQQQKATQQHAFKTAPAMSHEAMAEAQKQQKAREAAAAAPVQNTESAHGH